MLEVEPTPAPNRALTIRTEQFALTFTTSHEKGDSYMLSTVKFLFGPWCDEDFAATIGRMAHLMQHGKSFVEAVNHFPDKFAKDFVEGLNAADANISDRIEAVNVFIKEYGKRYKGSSM